MTIKTPWIRSILVLLATVGIAVATSGCDWADVGGPW
jgi:hypothetical protein